MLVSVSGCLSPSTLELVSMSCTSSSSSLQKPAMALVDEIVHADKRRETPNPLRFDIQNLLERRAGLLETMKGTSISTGLAKFAPQTYAQRNRACHSGLHEYEIEGQAQFSMLIATSLL